MKIVGFGDFLIHLSPVGDERFMQTDLMQMSFTGAEANVCAALSYWGEKTEFVTRLPDHFLAQKGRFFLKGLGVNTDNIPTFDARMGAYYLENGRSLRPSYVIYDRFDSAFTKSGFEDYDWNSILLNAGALVLTGITPSLSDSLRDCTVRLVKEANKHGLKVFLDLNYRPLLNSCEEFKDIISELLPYVTHLIGNEEHFKMIFGISSPLGDGKPYERLEHVTAKIKEYTGISNIAVTVRRTISASETVIYAGYLSGNDFAICPERQIKIVDRVGSGDAFTAGLVYGVMNGYSCEDTVCFASASSAFKHAVTKDINFATVDEIKGLVKSSRCDVKR